MVKVIVTGADGYIAGHTIHQLVNLGHSVVGTCRLQKSARICKKHFANFDYVVIPSFIQENVFDDVVRTNPDAEVFIHIASPVFLESGNTKRDLIDPIILGTENALKAAHKFGTIKHFVYTSSIAAVYNTTNFNPGEVFTEQLWNNVTLEEAMRSSTQAYGGSKTFAERAAWKYVKQNRPQFTLTVVNPVYVFGPQKFDEDARGRLKNSAGIIEHILSLRKGDPIAEFEGYAVDVRDVAKVLIAAFENPKTYGKRLIASSEFSNGQVILDLIKKNFPHTEELLPIGEPGSQYLAATQCAVVDNLATTSLLGIKWISLEDMVVDTVEQLLNENSDL
ncbi:CIC11C00000001820 [Sungouiella intermedia]|uniref:CIC11C00000001820 n=1 Tax=Sungouiella intermedia TaxID=45354 RepID=A0A1L0CU74_9ASCO|nr:CIC11C00000001820 [[Candida] intermedia]